MTTRRTFLGTLGKALGAGGLILPWAGKGALALPADLGKAASLPVVATPMPFSAEALELRRMRRALAKLTPLARGERGGGRWHRMMVGEYVPLEERLAARPVRSWTECVELAEAIWSLWEKEHRDGYYTGPMVKKLSRGVGGDCTYHQRDLIIALVEGVLALGGGERFDPRIEDLDEEDSAS